MNNVALLFMLIAGITSSQAQANINNVFGITGLGFVAPTVNGAGSSVRNPQLGEIVYDYTNGGFYGYDQTNNWVALGTGAIAPTAPTIQKLTASSGVYTTPAGVLYIRVKMVGAGGGGQGSSTPSGWAATAGNGGPTSFGTSLLTAGGGLGGSIQGGAGGTVSVSAPAVSIVEIIGATGSAGQSKTNTQDVSSGSGGTSPFGGAGGGTVGALSGTDAVADSGSGASGGGLAISIAGSPGAGGGAGGYVEAIITNPSPTYNFSVGSGGTPGPGTGTGNQPGGTGGSGVIIVEEYYQ